MNYYESQTPSSAASQKVDDLLGRLDFMDPENFKTDSGTSPKVLLTKDGCSNAGNAPVMQNLTAKENVVFSYVVARKFGENVAGLVKKQNPASGQSCYCLQLTDDPSQGLSKEQFLQVVLAMVD